MRQRPLTLTPREWGALCRLVGEKKRCAECGLPVERRMVERAFGVGESWVCAKGHEFPVVQPERRGGIE